MLLLKSRHVVLMINSKPTYDAQTARYLPKLREDIQAFSQWRSQRNRGVQGVLRSDRRLPRAERNGQSMSAAHSSKLCLLELTSTKSRYDTHNHSKGVIAARLVRLACDGMQPVFLDLIECRRDLAASILRCDRRPSCERTRRPALIMRAVFAVLVAVFAY